MGRIVLCADTESLVRPMLLGLEDVSLEGKGWLASIPDALEARAFVKNAPDVDEVWVVSSDQMEAANLVAGIAEDRPDVPLYLIGLGSKEPFADRAGDLGVTGVLSVEQFCERFDAESRRRSLMKEIRLLEIDGFKGASSLKAVMGDGADRGGAAVDCQSEGATGVGGQSEEVPVAGDAQPKDDASRAHAAAVRDRGCYTISVMSGSGGVGKSSFVALAACMAQTRGFRTAVVDADTQFGDISKMIAKAPRVSMTALLDDPSVLSRSSLDVSGELPTVIEAPDRIELSEALSGRIAEVVALCSKRFDVICIDTSSNWADDHAWILENSDCSLFMLDQRASSIRSVQRAVDLCMRMGVATGSFVYALNRCSRNAIFSGMDIVNVMQGAHVVEVKDGGSEVEEYLGAGLAADLVGLRNDCALSIDSLMGDLLPASAFFAGSPEWSLPSEGPRQGRHQRQPKRGFFPERRERKRRKDKRVQFGGEVAAIEGGRLASMGERL